MDVENLKGASKFQGHIEPVKWIFFWVSLRSGREHRYRFPIRETANYPSFMEEKDMAVKFFFVRRESRLSGGRAGR